MDIENINYSDEFVLVVDDEEFVREPIVAMLERLDFNADARGTGQEALEKLAEKHYTFLLTDIRMPGSIDGLELIRQTKEKYPDVCVIAMTGHSKEFNYVEVVNAGATDFVNKPFGIEELEAKIKRAIIERNNRQELNRLSITDSLTGLYNQRHFYERLKDERQELEHDPAWSQGNILLGRALMDLGRMTEAASVLEQNIKTSPDSVETRFLLGRAYLQLKQYEKAQGNFEAVIERDPATPYPYYGLARIYAHLGQKEKARQYSEQFRRLKAADDSRSVEALRQRELDLDFVRQTAAWTHVCAGQVHHTRGDPAKRAEHWRRAIQLDAICREALLSVCREAGLDPAQLLAGQGNPED